MPKSLASLILDALNDLENVVRLQILLQVGLDSLINASEECRLALLVDVYMSQSEPYLEELKAGLEEIRDQVGASYVSPTKEVE